jgi:hypothetical protein
MHPVQVFKDRDQRETPRKPVEQARGTQADYFPIASQFAQMVLPWERSRQFLRNFRNSRMIGDQY